MDWKSYGTRAWYGYEGEELVAYAMTYPRLNRPWVSVAYLVIDDATAPRGFRLDQVGEYADENAAKQAAETAFSTQERA